MSFIQDVPRTLVLNDQPFTVPEIRYLKGLFPHLDMVVLPKIKIRLDVTLQKSLRAGAVLCGTVQTSGDTAMLSLTQDGRLLLGKI